MGRALVVKIIRGEVLMNAVMSSPSCFPFERILANDAVWLSVQGRRSHSSCLE